jgi:geranylgeranyl reductase family protein
MKKYDVVIIGAGPGGLNCAYHLSGKKVLLLEKNKIIGPKVCAGGLTGHGVKYLNLPTKLLEFEYKEIKMHAKLFHCQLKSDRPFLFTFDREKLGQWQLKKIKNKVEVRQGTRVRDIKDNCLILNNQEKVGFKYLVGADGSNSMVRKHLKINTDKWIMGIQYIIKTKKYQELELFFDNKLFNGGYAWIFPHKDYVSIGCGSDPKSLSVKKLRKNFEKWLKKKGIDITKGEFQAFPINYDYQGYKFKNIFLVGDAAGLASGFSGEGVHFALLSGEEVAKKIVNPRYNPKKINEVLRIKNNHEKYTKFLGKIGLFRGLIFELYQIIIKLRILNKKIVGALLP